MTRKGLRAAARFQFIGLAHAKDLALILSVFGPEARPYLLRSDS
jgi:hypothetical protein